MSHTFPVRVKQIKILFCNAKSVQFLVKFLNLDRGAHDTGHVSQFARNVLPRSSALLLRNELPSEREARKRKATTAGEGSYERKVYVGRSFIVLLYNILSSLMAEFISRCRGLGCSAVCIAPLHTLIPRLHSDLCRQRCLQWYNGSLTIYTLPVKRDGRSTPYCL